LTLQPTAAVIEIVFFTPENAMGAGTQPVVVHH
jgi:hypothetical protein